MIYKFATSLLLFYFYKLEFLCLRDEQAVYKQGMESANNDARKWPILPFDVSRDFIISKEILV